LTSPIVLISMLMALASTGRIFDSHLKEYCVQISLHMFMFTVRFDNVLILRKDQF